MEKLKKDEKNFNVYIDKLKEMYDVMPCDQSKEVHKEVHDVLFRLGAFEKTSFLDDINKDTLGCILLIIVIILTGLINLPGIGVYLVGVVFFLFGYFVGLYTDLFGLIFLFSHGASGVAAMVLSVFGDIFNSPAVTDIPVGSNMTGIIIYIGIVAILFIVGFLMVVIHNISHNFRMRKHIALIPLAIFALGFILMEIFPKIVTYLF